MKKILSVILALVFIFSFPVVVSANETAVERLEDVDWSKAIYVDNMEYNNGEEYCWFVTYAIKDNIIYRIQIESDFDFEQSLQYYKERGYAPSCTAVAYLTDETQEFEVAEEVVFPSLDNLVSKVNAVTVLPNYSPSDRTHNIVKVTGYDFKEIDRNKIEKIVIPDSVESISGFNNLKSLKTVQIGKAVKTVDDGTFYKCPNLKNVSIDENNEFLEIRDTRIIDKTTNTQVFEFNPSKIYSVNKDVDSIKLNFVDNTVKSVVVNHTIKNFYNSTYSSLAKSVVKIRFKNNAKVKNDFNMDNSKLESVVFSKNQRKIDRIKSKKLTEIKFKKGLRVINEDAFLRCWKLSKVVIENTKRAPKIENSAFLHTKKGIKFYVKNKKVAKSLKKQLENSGAKKPKIYIGKKIYK